MTVRLHRVGGLQQITLRGLLTPVFCDVIHIADESPAGLFARELRPENGATADVVGFPAGLKGPGKQLSRVHRCDCRCRDYE